MMGWMDELDGREITSAYLSSNDSELLIFFKEGDPVSLQAEGDCCAQAYIESVDAPEWLKGIVLSTEEREGGEIDTGRGYDEVCDVTFYVISTAKGSCTIELRTEHNGYYGGWLCGSRVASPSLPLDWLKWKQLA